MVISFSKFKNGCGGATGGTVSGITLWSADYTREYIDSVVSGYTKTEDFATINGSAITEGGNIVIQGGSGGTEYYAGTNIDITNNVISVTGITVPTDISDLVDDIGIATTAWTNSAISGTMSAYTPTSGFSTINGSAITSGDNLIIEGTPYSGGTGIGVENHIISVTGDYETVVELTQAEYDALTAYSENTTYIITDAPAINMSAYTPTSGFSTINGSAITEGGNIVIQGGSNYSAGTNIDITNDVISVTGITVPTSNTAFTNDAGYVNSGEVETQITNKDYPTKNWVHGHVTLAISGKLDTDVFTAYTASTDTVLQNKVDTSAMTAYYTSAQTETAISSAITGVKAEIEAEIPSKVSDLQNDLNFVNSGQAQTQIDNSISGKADSSALTETNNHIDNMEEMTATALLELKNTKADATALTEYAKAEHVAELEQVTSAALNNLEENKADTSAVTASIAAATAATTGWVENQGYLTAYTETDPVFMASPASGISAQDITNWNNKLDASALTPYYTSAETNTAISNAVSGLASEEYVDNAVSGKVDTSALTETNNHIDNMEEMTAIALLDLKTNKADATALTEYAKSEHLGEVEQVTSVALNNLETNKVGSTDVRNMVVVTQAQYNALTPDPNTFYIIVG